VQVGDNWVVTVNQAYAVPTPVAGGTYLGTRDTTYLATITQGGVAGTDTIKFLPTTNNGYDGASEVTADTSGTAKAMVGYFNKLGPDFDVNDIEMIRDPKIQEKDLKIPKEYLTGHGWHTYTLKSKDGSALFEFKHNINGRDIYVNGTFDAVMFLVQKLGQPDNSKKLYTMIDVLKGN